LSGVFCGVFALFFNLGTRQASGFPQTLRAAVALALLLWVGVFSGCRRAEKEKAGETAASPSAVVPSTPSAVKIQFSSPSPDEIGSKLRVFRGKPPRDAVYPFLGEKVKWAGTFTSASSHRDEAVLEFAPERHPLPVLTILGMPEMKEQMKEGKSYIIEGIVEGAHGSQIVLRGLSIVPDPR
jgi:hypothetical protein